MKNYVKKGDVLDFVAPSGGVVSGQGYVLNSIFCVAITSAAESEKFSGVVEGVVSLAKDSTAFSAGDVVFWDNSGKEAGATGAGKYPVGYCVEDAATGAAEVSVKLSDGPLTAV